MADNDENVEQLQQEEDNTVNQVTNKPSLELLNGTELVSTDEESDGNEVVNPKREKVQITQQIDTENNAAGIGNGSESKNEDDKIAENDGVTSATASALDDNGNKLVESDNKEITGQENDDKVREGASGLDADKDIDETDEVVPPELEGDTSQSEIIMDSFPESQPIEIDQDLILNDKIQEISNTPDDSLLSDGNVEGEGEGEDGGSTTDTSLLAREIVQQALDQAVLTFNNESSSAPSMSSMQDLNIDGIHPEKADEAENVADLNANLEAHDSTEEVETEVIFESVKHVDKSNVINNEHEIDDEERGDGNGSQEMEVTDADGTQDIVISGEQDDAYQKGQTATAPREIIQVEENFSDNSDDEFGGLEKLAPLPQYPDFPENYGNYKVCRSLPLEPGVKECIILETGECVRCKKSYTGFCKTGLCIPSFSAKAVQHQYEDVVSSGDQIRNENVNMDEQTKGNVPQSPNVSISSSSSESGKQKSFRIVKSPNKEGRTAYSAVRSEEGSSCVERNNISQRDTRYDNYESFASLTNENERQFAYLDNLRSSRHEQISMNNQPQQQTASSQGQNSPREISYSQFHRDNQESFGEETREQQVHPVNRLSHSDAHIPLSYSSTLPMYNRNSDMSVLSDPSVLVRYQRNLISRNFPADITADTYANFRQAPSGSENDCVNEHRVRDDRNIDTGRDASTHRDQYELSDTDRKLLNEIYSKYGTGRTKEQVYDSFVSSASGDYGRNRSIDMQTSSKSSGNIPSFNTLQEQQESWLGMFRSLEQEHQDELRHQYQKHQQAIFNLQQQVEREIHVQEQSFQKKLNAHKEILAESSSPSRLTSSFEGQGNRSFEGQGHRSSFEGQDIRQERQHVHAFENADESVDRTDRRSRSSPRDGRSSVPTHRESSPPWREIYREIRENIEDSDDSASQNPIRRSLEKDFSPPDLLSSQLQTRTPTRSPRSPRDRRSGGKPELTSEGFPRAGVYSSPMPILRSKGSKSSSFVSDVNRTPPRDANNSMLRVTSPSLSEQRLSSTLKQDLESRHRERLEHQEERDSQLLGNSTASDDVYLSSSTRMNLREKHAKHLNDLREYYEKELSELRSAISTSENIMNQSPYKRVTSENQNLHVENRLLKEKVAELDDDLDTANRKIRELEQKVHGLEIRASDYADLLNESQSKLQTFRSKMEEMQYQSREREQLLRELEAKIKYQEDTLKKSKRKNTKNNEKLQDEQADIIVKDQSSVQKLLDKYNVMERDNNVMKEALNSTENKLYDARKEELELKRTVAKLELDNKRLGRENDNMRQKIHQQQSLNLSSIQGSFHEAFGSPDEVLNTSVSPHHKTSSSRLLNGSFHSQEVITEPPRTPQKSRVEDAAVDNDLPNGDSLVASPLMKAEKDVYKLRNMMRSCVQGQTDIPEPKLQKKFYGTDIPSQSRTSESFSGYSSPRFRRDKSPGSSPTSKNTKAVKSNRLSRSEQSFNSPSQSTPKRSQRRPSPKFAVEPEDFSSPTRFDVSSNGKRSRTGSGQKSSSRRQPGDGQPEKDATSAKLKSTYKVTKDRSVSSASSNSNNESVQTTDKDVQVSVTETLNRVRSGVYVTRPDWEDVNTSMVQPKKHNTEIPISLTREDRMRVITDMEHRYDDLHTEKRQLESSLSKVSSHGKGRLQKEKLENELDKVEKELGSVRMSLKRWNILKTSS